MHKQAKGGILLLLCAMIWGAAFVAQSESMQYIGPFTMGAARFFLAGLVLLPVIAVLDRKGWSQNRPVTGAEKKKQLLSGMICGVLLFAATTLQQFGLLDTTVGKSGFVTALYIVFVPILGALMGRRARLKVWLCALAAVFGMYLLCVGSGFSVSGGDLLTLGCAVLFAVHICYVGAVVPHMDGVRLSCVQFLVVLRCPQPACFCLKRRTGIPFCSAGGPLYMRVSSPEAWRTRSRSSANAMCSPRWLPCS